MTEMVNFHVSRAIVKTIDISFVDSLSNELLSEIFVHVDDETIRTSVPLVCKRWNIIVGTDMSLWMQKCIRNNIAIPPLISGYFHNYRKVYFRQPYQRNFVKNPSGEQEFEQWEVDNGGSGMVVERPPVGSDTEGFPVCFATSFFESRKTQVIDLINEGCDVNLLDDPNTRPQIVCEEWHAHRFDCASRYTLTCSLLDSTGETLSEREAYCKVEQWLGRRWEKKILRFTDYPAGVRQVVVSSRGCDSQFWAGNYGPKMAKASVFLTFSIDNSSDDNVVLPGNHSDSERSDL